MRISNSSVYYLTQFRKFQLLIDVIEALAHVDCFDYANLIQFWMFTQAMALFSSICWTNYNVD